MFWAWLSSNPQPTSVRPIPHPLSETNRAFRDSRVKMCAAGGFHTLAMFVWLFCLRQAKSLAKCWRKLSKLTKQSMGTPGAGILTYWNEVLKIILTGSTPPSLPCPYAVFVQLFSMRYLGAWNRLSCLLNLIRNANDIPYFIRPASWHQGILHGTRLDSINQI